VLDASVEGALSFDEKRCQSAERLGNAFCQATVRIDREDFIQCVNPRGVVVVRQADCEGDEMPLDAGLLVARQETVGFVA